MTTLMTSRATACDQPTTAAAGRSLALTPAMKSDTPHTSEEASASRLNMLAPYETGPAGRRMGHGQRIYAPNAGFAARPAHTLHEW